MNDEPYRPVSCAVHSGYELLAMHRAPVVLDYRDEAGSPRRIRGRVVDLFTKEGAEYLRLRSAGERIDVRLDRIRHLEKE